MDSLATGTHKSLNEVKELKGVKILALNVRSILPKWDLISNDLLDNRLDIVACSETWLTKDIPDSMLRCQDYNLYRLDRTVLSKGKPKSGGGVCLFLKRLHSVDKFIYDKFNCCTADIEMQCIKVNIGSNRSMAVINIYRPPSGNLNSAIESLNKVCENLHNTRRLDVICMGDFNVDWSDISNGKTKQLKTFALKWGLSQSINRHTRETAKSSSTIDLMFHNIENVFFSDVVHYHISDHSPIIMIKKLIKCKNTSTSCRGRSFRRFDEEAFMHTICQSDWDQFDNTLDPNVAWRLMYTHFVKAADEHCPVKSFKIVQERPPYITQETVALINDREYNYRKAKNSRTDDINRALYWQKALSLRKEVNNSIKYSKREYILNQFDDAKNNPTKFWKAMANLIPKKDDNSMSGVYDPNSGELQNGIQAANIVNEFFTKIGKTLNDKLPLIVDKFPVRDYDSLMPPMREIDIFAVDLQISRIDKNKSSGLSKLNAKLLKLALSCQLVRFTRLLKLCISTSIFPTDWKIGTVVPLPKKGDTRLTTNLRPVTLLPVPGKILENFLENHLSNYLNDNNILTPHQGGFRKNHSTQLSAFKLCNEIATALNSKRFAIVTYLDVSKAFDTINHEIILNY